MNRIFIGYDPREEQAYNVAVGSIRSRTPAYSLHIRSLNLEHLKSIGLLTRPIEHRDGKLWCPISEAPMATEFAISRFCVPFMAKGWALFCDSDVLCMGDIANLFALADPKYAVMVVKHNYQPKETVKMDGQVQTKYSRKNWSSVMLFNCDHPSNKKLTSEALNTWPGRDLHAFKWLDDSEIGELPDVWNYLVGANHSPIEQAKLIHFTAGGPFLPNWGGGPHDQLWIDEAQKLGVA